jgi:quercetin dioxygenase-like cupin family protein
MSKHHEIDPNDTSPPNEIGEIGEMSEMSDVSDVSDVSTLSILGGRIAEALIPLELPAARALRLERRLVTRVARSVALHRALHTVRTSDVTWQALHKGVRACVLHDDGASRSALVEFAPGASLPSHRHTTHEECIVLRGSLQADDSLVGLHDYHLAPAGSRHGRIQSQEGAVAFLRGTSIGKTGDMLREVAFAVLPGDGPSPTTIAAGGEGWCEVAEGAFVKPLWLHGASASMLLRLEAGARLPAHPLATEEECLMLSGEAFLGDILLRGGEYQRAPAGTDYNETFSDVGALLYVHGDAAYTRLESIRA